MFLYDINSGHLFLLYHANLVILPSFILNHSLRILENAILILVRWAKLSPRFEKWLSASFVISWCFLVGFNCLLNFFRWWFLGFHIWVHSAINFSIDCRLLTTRSCGSSCCISLWTSYVLKNLQSLWSRTFVRSHMRILGIWSLLRCFLVIGDLVVHLGILKFLPFIFLHRSLKLIALMNNFSNLAHLLLFHRIFFLTVFHFLCDRCFNF